MTSSKMLDPCSFDERGSGSNMGDGVTLGSGGGTSLLVKDPIDEYFMAVCKVELHLIDGMDPVGCINGVGTHFKVQSTLDDVEVKLAKLSMDGATIYLFNLLKETKEDLTWTRLKQALRVYGDCHYNNMIEDLFYLCQMGTIEEYIADIVFISL